MPVSPAMLRPKVGDVRARVIHRINRKTADGRAKWTTLDDLDLVVDELPAHVKESGHWTKEEWNQAHTTSTTVICRQCHQICLIDSTKKPTKGFLYAPPSSNPLIGGRVPYYPPGTPESKRTGLWAHPEG